MPSTLFFSWQADTPPATGRNFLRGVLELACRILNADGAIDEAARDLSVVSDTQDTPGHPPIVETIFRKIDGARVFVADMTFVATRADGGRSPNPNVLIEYGWALKSLSHERIILVMNTAYGEPTADSLPFDLRHARWPTPFNLPADVTAEAKAAEKQRLATDLARKIRACLAVAPAAAKPSRRIPFTEFRAMGTAAGWCGDIRAATIGDNDWWSFTTRLRQAAADGAIAFSGKRYLYDYGQELDSEPLIAIPRAHFEEFGFDAIQLAQAESTYDILTGRTGEPPSSLKGSIFRDLHVNEAEARAWLEGAGKPPAPADMAVKVESGGALLGDYKPVCSLIVTNIGPEDFERCQIEMIECSAPVPAGMPMPFVLRTASQMRGGERGRFLMSPGQDTPVPLFVHRPQRANEWSLIDKAGQHHPFSANPIKMLLRIYGGPSPGNVVVFVDTDASWKARPSVETVASDYSLYTEAPDSISISSDGWGRPASPEQL